MRSWSTCFRTVRFVTTLACMLGAGGCAVPVENGCASAADCAAREACDSKTKRCVPREDAGAMVDVAVDDAAPADTAVVDARGDAAIRDATPDLPPACDLDDDGYAGAQCGGGDCNETDATIHPGAAEDCFGDVDRDCDGATDNGCDDDGDGFCDAALDPAHCGDCCDESADARPGQATHFDAPTPCGDFDYDCNGTEDPELTATGGGCTCGAPYCYPAAANEWWADAEVAACGVRKTIATCAAVCPCMPFTTSDYTQRCR